MTWVQLSEFPDYSLSDLGDIRNDKRGTLVATSLTKQGAVKVGLMKGGKQHTRSVKVLVAETFVPGESDIFNTPIHLDGDQFNNAATNLIWRPRWFAWKYHNQLGAVDNYTGTGEVININTQDAYEDIADAAMANGLLFEEVHISVVNHIPVFPSWHNYEWL